MDRYPSEDPDFAKSIKDSGVNVILGAMRADHKGEGVSADDELAKASTLQPLSDVAGDRGKIRSADTALLPSSELAQVAKIGFVDTPPSALDGVRRVAPLVVRIGDKIFPTLSLQSLLVHWHIRSEQVQVLLGDAIILNGETIKRRIPIDETGAYLVNYRRDLANARKVDYWRLWEPLEARELVQDEPRGP